MANIDISYVPVPGYNEWQLYATREGHLYRNKSFKNGTECFKEIGSNHSLGYREFNISNQGVHLRGLVHVMIARTFILNPKTNQSWIISVIIKAIILLKIYVGLINMVIVVAV